MESTRRNLTSQSSGEDYMLHFHLEMDGSDLFETFGNLHETKHIYVFRIKKFICWSQVLHSRDTYSGASPFHENHVLLLYRAREA